MPTETTRPGEHAVADAADSVHGGRQADGAGVARCSRSTSRRTHLAANKIGADVHAAGAESDHARRAPAAAPTTVRSPTARRPACSTSRPSTARSTPGRPRRKGYFSAYDPATGELVWQQTFEGYGQAGSVVTAGGVVFVGSGSNIAGYFFAYDAQDRRAAVEVQHRRRRVLVAVGLHGQRRGVRDGGVGRRRARPARRRSRSELRAAEVAVAT